MTKLEQYVVADQYSINTYYKQGYRFVAVVQESYSISEPVNFSGSMMNNNFNLSGNTPKTSVTTKFLMELNPTAQVLFGEKNNGKDESTS